MDHFPFHMLVNKNGKDADGYYSDGTHLGEERVMLDREGWGIEAKQNNCAACSGDTPDV